MSRYNIRKISFAVYIALLTGIGNTTAQTINHALNFSKDGLVQCGAMPQLDNSKDYSIQFWMKPDIWSPGATILHRGNFMAKLAKDNTLEIVNGSNLVKVAGFDPGSWNQVTLITRDGEASVLVNGVEAGKGTLGSLEETKRGFILGGNYQGLLDEVRVWNASLNDMMKRFDFFTNNTLNKWNPMWENLVAYYKMDQAECPQLVDYKVIENPRPDATDNHGELSGGVQKIAVNNDKMPYLINAAYTENNRFYDRCIPQDQYLLSNEIIILGADAKSADGSIAPRTPNNHAELKGNAVYLPSFMGKDGVLSLDGNSWIMAPAGTLKEGAGYTFYTYIYLDDYVPGAYLIKNENEDNSEGFALYFGGTESDPVLIARVNGKTAVSGTLTDLKKGKWLHLAAVPQSAGKSFSFFVDGKKVTEVTSEIADVTLGGNISYAVEIGKGIKGKLDETAIWNQALSDQNIVSHMNWVPTPTAERNVAVATMNTVGAYYRYDDVQEPGFSTHSQDNWAKYIRSMYEGYTSPQIVLSVRSFASGDSDLTEIINNPQKCEKFAEDLAKLSERYDGVELDLEWIYSAADWKKYHDNLSKAIISKLPAGKSFRISTHNVTYNYPKDGIKDDGIDGFTFQMYGPNYAQPHFSYSNFEQRIKDFINYGYPKDKIMSSFATTTSKNSAGDAIQGIRGAGFYDSYILPEIGEEPDVDEANGRKFMSPMQVYKRAKHTRNQNLQGIFYWDMGNDYWINKKNSDGIYTEILMPEFNAAKYCSYGLNSNIDRIVDEVVVNHSATEEEPPLDDSGSVASLENMRESLQVYNLQGLSENKNANKDNILENLNKGVYIINGKKVFLK